MIAVAAKEEGGAEEEEEEEEEEEKGGKEEEEEAADAADADAATGGEPRKTPPTRSGPAIQPLEEAYTPRACRETPSSLVNARTHASHARWLAKRLLFR